MSPTRTSPPCRACLGFAAEPPLAMRSTDARAGIVGISRHVVYALAAGAADVSLDVAGAAVAGRGMSGVLAGGPEAFAAAPFPRRNKLSTPEPPPRRLRQRLLLHVRPRVPAECQRPSLAGQPGADVPPRVPAYGDDTSIAIPFFASDPASVDLAGQRLGRPAAAGPAAPPVEAGLSAFRRIDAPETDSSRTDFNRVTVEHSCDARQIRPGRLWPLVLDPTAHLVPHGLGSLCCLVRDRPGNGGDVVEGVLHHVSRPNQNIIRHREEQRQRTEEHSDRQQEPFDWFQVSVRVARPCRAASDANVSTSAVPWGCAFRVAGHEGWYDRLFRQWARRAPCIERCPVSKPASVAHVRLCGLTLGDEGA